jgi:uncharacterized Zn-binding protein involved in type VI secretion
MSRRVIRVGDATDHGGHVGTSGAPQFKVDGIAVALKGDPCPCPDHGKDCLIAEGDPHHTINGIPVAYEGHKTTCGAVLIASIAAFAKD